MTLQALLQTGADEAVAISAPGRAPLDYRGLRALVAQTTAALNAGGIGRNDRVAIVLPNGPEMACCFLACASAATSAPLNPAYRVDEFEFYLDDLQAKALIVEQGSQSPAVDAARKLGVQVIELVVADGAPAGQFGIADLPAAECNNGGPSQPDDVAMVLHTSGTTSRPKRVPLTVTNLCASAGNIAKTLQFSASDVGLNIMPLFHIHGLLAGLLAPLSAGSQVYCTPGFNALRFYKWLDDAKPSWYTAVPTMHLAIASRGKHNAEVLKRHALRFVRSSSSAMPPQLIKEIEGLFKAPLIESYGMTESAHQMASNPLPPAERKPGTVGRAAGPEIRIRGEDGGFLGAGEVGEIVIRGPNVTPGYENNPKANEEAFVDGWFRTGDQGSLDDEGYLSITGRLKEIINRGGEKVSPREIDEILLDHVSVAQVVVFGAPHKRLGEEVAAMVVLHEGHECDERELQQFVAKRVAGYKVPKKILFVDELPKGATGKLQRIGLAQRIGLGFGSYVSGEF
ncbi:acyl--CoA ligase [Piscinibacter sakaiensis]|uniref:acyl--CoA ligase n=1 Tax=Piscinibacter sakaiensis TaxID=1547922 RepID=UPI003AACEB16